MSSTRTTKSQAPTKGATTTKAASGGSTAKKPAAKKPAAKKAAPKKAAAKKPAPTRSSRAKAAAAEDGATTATAPKKAAAPKKKPAVTKTSVAPRKAAAPEKKPTTSEASATKKSLKRSTKKAKAPAAFTAPLAPLLRPGPGASVADVDTRSTPGWDAGRKVAKSITSDLGRDLSELQERLFAEGRSGGTRSVLLVLQGMDTSGKGGVVRHVLGMVDPQGVTIRSFGVPTEEERSHHYLWRIRNALPAAGRIGVFDRSHYEDVLVVKVDGLADAEEIDGRYDEIVDFERELVAAGTTVVKVALVISPTEQYERLSERLDRPDKHWKFAVSDLETRARWPLYTEAYDRVLERTSTDEAPWHVVPADRKWYARLVVTQLLVDALRGLDLTWPEATFDVAAAVAALDATRDDPTALSPAEVEEHAERIEG